MRLKTGYDYKDFQYKSFYIHKVIRPIKIIIFTKQPTWWWGSWAIWNDTISSENKFDLLAKMHIFFWLLYPNNEYETRKYISYKNQHVLCSLTRKSKMLSHSQVTVPVSVREMLAFRLQANEEQESYL